jgi:tetratricopeptide (TPR) repeat protein
MGQHQLSFSWLKPVLLKGKRMLTQPPPAPAQPDAPRAYFIGRVQEQRQFLVALRGLLTHQHHWRDLAYLHGADFDPGQAPPDDSYARIFLLHGIGGIGKSWLARRCLTLAQQQETDPPILTLYDDVSLGPPVLEPGHLLERLYAQLVRAGHEAELAAYRQAQAAAPGVVERVSRYQAESRERWETCLSAATALVAQESHPAPHPIPPGAYRPPSTTEAIQAQAYHLLLEQMAHQGKISAGEAELFRHPAAVQSARLVEGLQRLARRRPIIIALDNLEIMVPLEPFLRDSLVLPTNQAPLIWILSSRYNLADERLAEVNGQAVDYKGYRDLLGDNPPVVWDMSIFGDADLADYLEAEAGRRGVTLTIDDALIDAVKSTSSGVPLVVEMVADAFFSMPRDEFLRDFALDDKTLLPAGRLEQITTRFLRYCMQREDDLERVYGLALLPKSADEAAWHAVWGLPLRQSARALLQELHLRYAFIQRDGLNDTVYDFVRRQLRTLKEYRDVRTRLGNRAVTYYQHHWSESEEQAPGDPLLRVRDPHWQRATLDLLNALLWTDPDEAVRFLLPRFVEGLSFDRPFAESLLLQAEEFRTDAASPISRGYANLLQHLRTGLHDIGYYDEPGAAVGKMVDRLLQTADLEPLHQAILYLWRGDWLVPEQRYPEALKAYLAAEKNLPATAASLRRQLGQSFYKLSSIFLWPESTLQVVASESGLQAAQQSTALDPANGAAWYNLGVALDHLEREAEAVPAYQRSLELEPRAGAYNGLGDVYTALGRYDEAQAAYQNARALNPSLAWPYHNLGLLAEHRGDYQAAIPLYQQALERHQRDQDRAVTWDNLGNVYAALNQADEAIAAYRRAGLLHPSYASPWHGLGDVFSRLNRADEAIAAYRQAIALDPAEPWPYHNLALVYEQADDSERAVELYRQALKRHRDDRSRAVSWHNLGDTYRAAGRTAEALSAYQQAVKLDPHQAGYFDSLGDLYALLDRNEEAIAAYQQAVVLDPNHALSHNSLGRVYGRLGRAGEAISAYQRVLALNPHNAWAYNNLGFIYAGQGDLAAAITCYRQALQHHQQPADKAITWHNLGQAYEALYNEAEALAAYQQATQHDPSYAWPWYYLGLLHQRHAEPEAALAAFQKALEYLDYNADKARAWNQVGDVYCTLDRRPEALEAYQQATELDSAFALPWNSLGDLYRVEERWAKADSAYRRANRLDPNLAWPYHNLAWLLARRGEHETALEWYQQALARHQRNEDLAISWNRLGESYRALVRWDEARHAYQQANAADPIYPWPYHNLGLLAEQEHHWPAALTFFQQALDRHQRDPDRAVAWHHLGNVYRGLAQPAQALEAYHHAAELDPTYAEPWRSLGDIYRTSQQPQEALEAYRQAIRLDPAEPWPYHYLGWLHQQRGEFEAAGARYEQALKRHRADPDRAISWHHLGQVNAALNRPQEAIKAFRQAGALDPGYALPWHHLGDTYRHLNQPDQAIAAYEYAAKLDPDYAATWSNLGDLYRVEGQADQASLAYRRTIELEPANAWAYHYLAAILAQTGDHAQTLTYYRQAIERHTHDHAKALAWTGLGEALQALEQVDQAMLAYQQASRFDPAYPWPYHHLGQLYQQQRQYEPALSYYQQAIANHPRRQDQAELWERLGLIYQLLGRYPEAAEAYQRVTELTPRQALAWNSLGTVYRLLERLDEAVAAYQQAIALDPTLPWPYHHLGMIYEQRSEYEAALKQYQHALERHPETANQAVVWDRMGQIRVKLGQPVAAIEAYRRAAALDPSYAAPWSNLGDVYRSQDQAAEAVAAYEQAVQLDPAYAWPYHHLGLIYAERQNFQPAVIYLRRALERHPRPQDQALAWYGLGQVYQAMPQPAAAAEAYQQAISLDPGYPWSYHHLGALHASQGHYQAAQQLYRQALQRHPSDDPRRALSWRHLGNTCVGLGDLTGAAQAYQQAITADPSDASSHHNLGDIYAVLKRHDEAIAAYQQAAKLDPAYVLPQTGLGNVYVRLGRFDEAVRAYQRALELNPADAWLYRHLALAYEQQNNYPAAQQAYQQAIEHTPAAEAGPEQAVLWTYLGHVHQILRHYDEAISAYQRAIELDGRYALPWNSLGSIYTGLERVIEAVTSYRAAIQRDPDYAWPYHNLGLICEKQEQYDEAIKLYQEAIVRHPQERDQAVSWHRLGKVYEKLGQYERAIVVYRRAIELNPTSALPWNSLGDVYNDLGQPDAAILAYRQAIDLDPNYAWPYNNLGVVYEKLGQYEQAMTLYRQIIERQPGNSDEAVSWNNLGNAYSALNQADEAIQAYQHAIELDPSFIWPYHNLGALYEQRGESELAVAFYEQAAHRHKQKVTV